MKHTTVALFLLISLNATAQSLKRDEPDKFLKVHIKETSWEVLAMPFSSALRFRCKSIDDIKYIEFRITLHSVFRIDEGDRIYLLFDDDESIPIECNRGAVANFSSAYGITYWWEDFLYPLSEKVAQKIKTHHVIAARVGTGGEYVEFNKVKEKNSGKLRKAVALISE